VTVSTRPAGSAAGRALTPTWSAVWQYAAITNIVDPGAGFYRSDATGSPDTATTFALSTTDAEGANQYNALVGLAVGDSLLVQSTVHANSWASFALVNVTDWTSWVQLDVTNLGVGSAATMPGNTQPVLFDFVTGAKPATVAGWPSVDDVKNLLRLADSPGDDALVASDLAAAIGWTINRCASTWVDPASAEFLPAPLYSVALHEAGRLVRRRDSVDGTIGWGDMGVVRVGPKDPDIETLITAYLAIPFG
jgi:hypothetical protein